MNYRFSHQANDCNEHRSVLIIFYLFFRGHNFCKIRLLILKSGNHYYLTDINFVCSMKEYYKEKKNRKKRKKRIYGT